MKALDDFIRNDFAVHEAKQTTPAGPLGIEAINAAELAGKDFQPLVQAVDGLIVEGCTLLCGSSKIGKSWAALQMASAVAAGEPFWGRETTQGAVLYMALEDSERRLKHRLEKMGVMPSANLFFQTEAITMDAGLVNALEGWITAHPDARLIIIDTLQKVRGAVPARANAYGEDYRFIAPIKALADRFHVAVVLVHHLNKLRNVEDPFDRISGSTGLMGAADTTILITRNRDEEAAKVTYAGRDVYGDDFEIAFEDCRWRVCDPAMLARERYEKSPAVRAVKLFMAQGSFEDVRRMTYEAFRVWALDAHGLFLGARPQEVKKLLEPLAEQLARYDGIQMQLDRRIGSERGMALVRV